MSGARGSVRVLVTGASGYVGGRLVIALLEAGYQVRAMSRSAEKLKGRWDDSSHRLELIEADTLDATSLDTAMEEVDFAFYLIHGMGDLDQDFRTREETSARNFALAATAAGVKRILYLGGLGPRNHSDSKHLNSRHHTGDVLRKYGPSVTELRAAMILGSGSASFEILRHLTEKLPIMITPRWVRSMTQPILITDAIQYLIRALEEPKTADKIIDIGGPEPLSYGDLIRAYADVRGLKRFLVPVPVLTPRLSAYWVNLVTPVPNRIAFPLIEGLRNDTVVENELAQELMPIHVTPVKEAIRRALDAAENRRVPTRWSGAGHFTPNRLPEPESGERLLHDRQTIETTASAESLRRAFTRIGGKVGWYYGNQLWSLRGFFDRLIGGVGVRRGRRDPEQVFVGEALDFWRVEAYEPRRMLLRAEMKVPGRAWLEFRVEDQNDHRVFHQVAHYWPGGILGYAYWYAISIFHLFIFRGMAKNLVRWAEAEDRRLAGSRSEANSSQAS